MKIIRDEEGFGIFMIPLFCDWNVKRCNVEGCTEKPSTILTDLGEGIPVAGMCERHFQEGKEQAKTAEIVMYSFIWDEFDAFKAHESKKGDR